MHQGGSRSMWVLLIVSAALLCDTFINKKNDDAAPSKDIQELDAKLLTDLRTQKIQPDSSSALIMQCAKITTDDLKKYFDIDLVNYVKCEEGNCHVNSYTIEGKTADDQPISFKLDAGEDGNFIRDLQISGSDCN